MRMSSPGVHRASQTTVPIGVRLRCVDYPEILLQFVLTVFTQLQVWGLLALQGGGREEQRKSESQDKPHWMHPGPGLVLQSESAGMRAGLQFSFITSAGSYSNTQPLRPKKPTTCLCGMCLEMTELDPYSLSYL